MAAFPLEYISNLFNTDYILILHQSTILNQKTPITYSSFPSPCSLLSSLYSLESWYTAPRAPLVSLGATVSGNCFDHYRSMPDGNQIGLFCCQTPRFRKEAPLPAGNGKGGRSHRFDFLQSYKSEKSYKSYKSDKSFFGLLDL